ncbi:hypothetical protein FDP41_003230 [Naegleria fowleri]|uniref:Translin n=1 Tax=Naegleria fowleri TaxID=5763 RepID=A0A6A5BVF3_NAEFO|nr:uncharacterized protein FDP41_003230 [Naegleria fowleri]KAF0977908.1 hypothetical protein FDP41_003230 [Naegleria fowleri]
MDQIFQQTKEYFEELESIKEKIQSTIKELDEPLAILQGLLQKIHQNKPNFSDHVKELCKAADPYISQCAESLAKLSACTPVGGYYKYYNMWQYRLSNLCSVIALKHFITKDLENDIDHALITKEETEKLLGIDKLENFQLPLEDYLYGLCNLFSELNRYSVNCVIRLDFAKPFIIKEFLTQIYDGFKLLNLKNDSLRKRFDAIKYDVKKCEEIIYDLSIRGLNPQGKSVNLSVNPIVSNLDEKDEMQQDL